MELLKRANSVMGTVQLPATMEARVRLIFWSAMYWTATLSVCTTPLKFVMVPMVAAHRDAMQRPTQIAPQAVEMEP